MEENKNKNEQQNVNVDGNAQGGHGGRRRRRHRHKNHGGNGGTGIGQQMNEQQGAHRGHGDVDDVVADEDGGDHPVVLVGQGQSQFGLFVAVLSKLFHLFLIERNDSHLGASENCVNVYKNKLEK